MTSTSLALERFDAYLEGQATSSQSAYAVLTALGVILLSAQYEAQARYAPSYSAVSLPGFHQETAQVLTPVFVTEADLISALVDFHNRLLAVQEDLAPDAAKILHTNLWRLYE